MTLDLAPRWDNSTEYPSISSEEFRADYDEGLLVVSKMESAIQPISAFVLAKEADFSDNMGELLLFQLKNFRNCSARLVHSSS